MQCIQKVNIFYIIQQKQSCNANIFALSLPSTVIAFRYVVHSILKH